MDKFDKMYKGSWYTITGAGGDINEWKEGYNKMLADNGIGSVDTWEVFSGLEMNQRYGLTGSNAYKDDLTFLAFPLDGLDILKLSFFKVVNCDRWFDDIVDNNEIRENFCMP